MLLLKWILVVFGDLIYHRFVNGYYTNPSFEDVQNSPLCDHGCLFTEADVNLPAKCRVPGASHHSNVTFIIGNNVRLLAQLQGDAYKAPGYTVLESDHSKTLTCDVTELDGTGRSQSQVNIFIIRDSTAPVIHEQQNGNNLALTCSTRNGRPPPDLQFTVGEKRLESEQNGDEAIVLPSAHELHGKKIECCKKSPFYSTKCSPSYTVNYEKPATLAPTTQEAKTTKRHEINTKMTSSTIKMVMTSEAREPEVQDRMKSTTNGAPSNVIRIMTLTWLTMTTLAIIISF